MSGPHIRELVRYHPGPADMARWLSPEMRRALRCQFARHAGTVAALAGRGITRGHTGFNTTKRGWPLLLTVWGQRVQVCL